MADASGERVLQPAGGSPAGAPVAGDGASDVAHTLAASVLLHDCSDVDIAELRARSSEKVLAAGQLLFGETEVTSAVWVILDGELVLTKLTDGDEVIIAHLMPGEYLGEISLLTQSPTDYRARAKGVVRVLEIPGPVFNDLLRSCQGVSVTVLRTMAKRVRWSEQMLQQRERMAALGTLAAGLAHELNNPASAAKRAAALLKEQIAALEPLAERLAARQWLPAEVALLSRLAAETGSADREAQDLDALARSDREDAVGRWLDGHDIDRAWELAPVLVERGVTVEKLESVMRGCDPSAVSDALAWAERMAAIRQMLDEVEGSTIRMAQVVKAVKAYSYADTTSLRSADVHEALENTLTILGHKLRDVGATVERQFDRTLPPIQMYGAELGQVWTNLLDNAADAVAAAPAGSAKRITVRTTAEKDGVRVEIEDTGQGIPPDVVPKIFEPFFTTKDAGKGTGLGLEIVKRIVTRHAGAIEVSSVPGATRFTVRLPLRQPTPSPAVQGKTGDLQKVES